MVKAIITFETSDPDGFQNALGKVGGALAGAKGYHGQELRRGVELPKRFLLFVDWDAVADHMAWMGVNEKTFLGAVGPYLASPPDIKHYQ